MKIQDTHSQKSGQGERIHHELMALLQRRDFHGAVACFEMHQSALESCRGTEAGAILHAAAKAHASLTHLPIALRLARRAQAMAAQDGDTSLMADICVTIGRILRDLGELKEAEKAWRDAESIFRRNDNLPGQSDALNLLAGLLFQKCDYRNAVALLMDAVAIARKLDDKQKLAYMMGNIGRIYTFTGDFDEAERHLLINVDLSRRLSDELETERAFLSLGYLQIQKQQYAKASESLAEAYRLIVHLNRKRDEVVYLTYLGELQYRMDQHAEARESLQRALTMAEAIAPRSVLDARVMRHLAELSVRTGDYRRAQQYVSEAMPLMEKSDQLVEMGALHKLAGLINQALGHKDKARQSFLRGLDLLAESGVRFEKAEALIALGRSELFSIRERMTYLFRAEEFYMRSGLTARQEEINQFIGDLDKPRTGDTTSHRKGKIEHDPVDYLTVAPAVLRIKAQIAMLTRTDLPVLITGETGVGKDHMARYFHATVRPDKPYVAINCASLPETLLESELFGYHRGAFTGAVTHKQGLFVTANGGVLMLDEIGDLPLSLQAKLLGVIEKRRVLPLGSTQEVALDIKLVAATNKNLQDMVDQGTFRQDLFFRLSGIHFHIPPLRERKEDIPLLLEQFLVRHHLLAAGQKVPAELVKQFVDYDWPGNIRELENKVRRLEVMAQLVAEGDVVELARSLFGGDSAPARATLFDRVHQFERQLIMEALMATNGNKCEAARLLGVHEATVRLKLKRYLSAAASGSVN
ncbi:MAG: sigma 54-interacting transcriptional regulator [Candidatus Zixiibacteriota bacterium]